MKYLSEEDKQWVAEDYQGPPSGKPPVRVQRAGSMQTAPSLCEMREGIGLCDDCAKPKWPQKYMGYGCMVCLDCIAAAEREASNGELNDRRNQPES